MGDSPVMRSTRELLARLAPTRHPVVVTGPSGSGKELAARALHDQSGRRGKFVAINCGALPETLATSALFGHARGAFTGALRDHAGAFARAHNGTLFLDEVAELSAQNQAMLLRVLETGTLTPVGAEREVVVQARTVTATHRDLVALVTTGVFREDLFHRLRVLEVRMPPLAERPEDIPALLKHFGGALEAELKRPIVVTSTAVRWAQVQPWPGNVRELRNALTRAAVVGHGEIDATALAGHPNSQPRCTATATSSGAAHDQQAAPCGTYRAMHRAMLERAVREHGSIRQAARALQVPRSTLGAWLRRHPPPATAGSSKTHGPRRVGSSVA